MLLLALSHSQLGHTTYLRNAPDVVIWLILCIRSCVVPVPNYGMTNVNQITGFLEEVRGHVKVLFNSDLRFKSYFCCSLCSQNHSNPQGKISFVDSDPNIAFIVGSKISEDTRQESNSIPEFQT